MRGQVLQVPNTMTFYFQNAQIRRVDWIWEFFTSMARFDSRSRAIEYDFSLWFHRDLT